jgi:hypothetical protein
VDGKQERTIVGDESPLVMGFDPSRGGQNALLSDPGLPMLMTTLKPMPNITGFFSATLSNQQLPPCFMFPSQAKSKAPEFPMPVCQRMSILDGLTRAEYMETYMHPCDCIWRDVNGKPITRSTLRTMSFALAEAADPEIRTRVEGRTINSLWSVPGEAEPQRFTGRVVAYCAPGSAAYNRLSREQKAAGGDWWMIEYDENEVDDGGATEFMRWSDVQQILDDDQLGDVGDRIGDEAPAKATVAGILNVKAEWCAGLPIAEVFLDGRTKHFCSTVTYNEKGGTNHEVYQAMKTTNWISCYDAVDVLENPLFSIVDCGPGRTWPQNNIDDASIGLYDGGTGPNNSINDQFHDNRNQYGKMKVAMERELIDIISAQRMGTETTARKGEGNIKLSYADFPRMASAGFAVLSNTENMKAAASETGYVPMSIAAVLDNDKVWQDTKGGAEDELRTLLTQNHAKSLIGLVKDGMNTEKFMMSPQELDLSARVHEIGLSIYQKNLACKPLSGQIHGTGLPGKIYQNSHACLARVDKKCMEASERARIDGNTFEARKIVRVQCDELRKLILGDLDNDDTDSDDGSEDEESDSELFFSERAPKRRKKVTAGAKAANVKKKPRRKCVEDLRLYELKALAKDYGLNDKIAGVSIATCTWAAHADQLQTLIADAVRTRKPIDIEAPSANPAVGNAGEFRDMSKWAGLEGFSHVAKYAGYCLFRMSIAQDANAERIRPWQEEDQLDDAVKQELEEIAQQVSKVSVSYRFVTFTVIVVKMTVRLWATGE